MRDVRVNAQRIGRVVTGETIYFGIEPARGDSEARPSADGESGHGPLTTKPNLAQSRRGGDLMSICRVFILAYTSRQRMETLLQSVSPVLVQEIDLSGSPGEAWRRVVEFASRADLLHALVEAALADSCVRAFHDEFKVARSSLEAG